MISPFYHSTQSIHPSMSAECAFQATSCRHLSSGWSSEYCFENIPLACLQGTSHCCGFRLSTAAYCMPCTRINEVCVCNVPNHWCQEILLHRAVTPSTNVPFRNKGPSILLQTDSTHGWEPKVCSAPKFSISNIARPAVSTAYLSTNQFHA